MIFCQKIFGFVICSISLYIGIKLVYVLTHSDVWQDYNNELIQNSNKTKSPLITENTLEVNNNELNKYLDNEYKTNYKRHNNETDVKSSRHNSKYIDKTSLRKIIDSKEEYIKSRG